MSRTTKDTDILSIKKGKKFIDPEPFPEYIIKAVQTVATVLELPEDWLNTGPADIFRMGLPEGLEERLLSKEIGSHLKVHFIGRLDQIYFKLYASVDRGGYHIEDLLSLSPTEEELIQAGKWVQTHDVSPEFKKLLQNLLSELGYKHAASRI